jgi:hypothetical protein
MTNSVKPVIDIHNAYLVTVTDRDKFLCGRVPLYPKLHKPKGVQILDGHNVKTSRVLNISGPFVETERSIYNVVSWSLLSV